VAFYRIGRSTSRKYDLPFKSLSLVHYDDRVTTRHPTTGRIRQCEVNNQGVRCCVQGLSACLLNDTYMRPLAQLFPGNLNHQSTPPLYDWGALLGYHDARGGLGATVSALNQFAETLHAPFAFQETADVAECNRFFHMWFQSLHAVRLTIIEGAHRCETAMRLFYGYGIGDKVPLQRDDNFQPINPSSSMVVPINVRVVTPNQRHSGVITNEVLSDLREYSDSVQQERSRIVLPTYTTLWRTIYDACFDQVLEQPRFKEVFHDLTLPKFMNLPFVTQTHDDLFSQFVDEIARVVVDTFYTTEPGRTAVQGIPRAEAIQHTQKTKIRGRNNKGIREASASSVRSPCPTLSPLTSLFPLLIIQMLDINVLIKHRMFQGLSRTNVLNKCVALHFTICIFTSQFITAEGRLSLNRFLNSTNNDIHDPNMLARYVAPPINNVLDCQLKRLEDANKKQKDTIVTCRLFWAHRHHHFIQLLDILGKHGLRPEVTSGVNATEANFYNWVCHKSKWAKQKQPGQAIVGMTQLVILGYAYDHSTTKQFMEPFRAFVLPRGGTHLIDTETGLFRNQDDVDLFQEHNYGLGDGPTLTEYFLGVLNGKYRLRHKAMRAAYTKLKDAPTTTPTPAVPRSKRKSTTVTPQQPLASTRHTRSRALQQTQQPDITGDGTAEIEDPAEAATATPSPKKKKKNECTECAGLAKDVKTIAADIENGDECRDILRDVQDALKKHLPVLKAVTLVPATSEQPDA
jgi:hypothetical protein